MSIAEQYTSAVNQAQGATEQYLDLFKQGTATFKDQLGTLANLPDIDSGAAKQYFDLVQQALDAGKELTLQWIKATNSWTSIVREQARTVGSLLGN